MPSWACAPCRDVDSGTGLPAHEVGDWREARLDLIDLQMCRGLVFERPDAVAKAYGDALTTRAGTEFRKGVGVAWW